MIKKTILVLLTAALTLGGLAGCGNSGSSDKKSETSSSASSDSGSASASSSGDESGHADLGTVTLIMSSRMNSCPRWNPALFLQRRPWESS